MRAIATSVFVPKLRQGRCTIFCYKRRRAISSSDASLPQSLKSAVMNPLTRIRESSRQRKLRDCDTEARTGSVATIHRACKLAWYLEQFGAGRFNVVFALREFVVGCRAARHHSLAPIRWHESIGMKPCVPKQEKRHLSGLILFSLRNMVIVVANGSHFQRAAYILNIVMNFRQNRIMRSQFVYHHMKVFRHGNASLVQSLHNLSVTMSPRSR